MENIHFIINPASGQPEPILQTINSVLQEAGIEWTISITTPDDDGTALAQSAIDDGADLIVSYGGDGTVHNVINGLAGTDVPLGLLHGGTGNALAHELNIPTDLAEATQLLIDSTRVKALDLGRVECDTGKDRYFVLRSNVGLHNLVLKNATRELKEQFGNLAYLIAGFRSLPESKPLSYHLTIDGERVEAEGLTCTVVNSGAFYGALQKIFPLKIDPTDGQLDVFVLDSRFESLISMVNSSIEADMSEFPNHWQGREIQIEMDEPTGVTLDGEAFCETPVRISVVPGALRVLVPSE